MNNLLKTGITDSDGKEISVGDTVNFSYGMPGIWVWGRVVIEEGIIWVLTQGHNPKKSRLNKLEKYVGEFYRDE